METVDIKSAIIAGKDYAKDVVSNYESIWSNIIDSDLNNIFDRCIEQVSDEEAEKMKSIKKKAYNSYNNTLLLAEKYFGDTIFTTIIENYTWEDDSKWEDELKKAVEYLYTKLGTPGYWINEKYDEIDELENLVNFLETLTNETEIARNEFIEIDRFVQACRKNDTLIYQKTIYKSLNGEILSKKNRILLLNYLNKKDLNSLKKYEQKGYSKKYIHSLYKMISGNKLSDNDIYIFLDSMYSEDLLILKSIADKRTKLYKKYLNKI